MHRGPATADAAVAAGPSGDGPQSSCAEFLGLKCFLSFWFFWFYKSLKLVLELGMRLVGAAPPLTLVLVNGPIPRGCAGKPGMNFLTDFSTYDIHIKTI